MRIGSVFAILADRFFGCHLAQRFKDFLFLVVRKTTRRSSVRTSVSGQNWELVDVSFLVVERGRDTNLARRRVDLELSVLAESVAHRVVDDGVDSAIRICGRYLHLKKKRQQNKTR